MKFTSLFIFIILPLQLFAVTFNAATGTIWNQQDANRKCPLICKHEQGAWTGRWQTLQGSMTSTCQCHHLHQTNNFQNSRCIKLNIATGPIWHDYNARNICPRVCHHVWAQWTGQWQKATKNLRANCECLRCDRHYI